MKVEKEKNITQVEVDSPFFKLFKKKANMMLHEYGLVGKVKDGT